MGKNGCLFITETFILDTFGKTTSEINSICLTIYWEKFMVYLLHHQYQYLSDETCSSAAVLTILLFGASISLFIWTTFISFSFRSFTYQLNFSVFWALNLLSTSILFPSLLLLVFFWMLWMLFFVNKPKCMQCHGPHVLQIISTGIFVTEFFKCMQWENPGTFSLSNEKILVLVTRVLRKNLEKQK